MTNKAIAIAMFSLTLLAGGCGQSGSQQGALAQKQASAGDTTGLCRAIEGTGLIKQCTVNSQDRTVHVVIDSNDDQVARNTCADVVSRMAQPNAALSAQWMLQIYSPYRDDKPLAGCPLN